MDRKWCRRPRNKPGSSSSLVRPHCPGNCLLDLGAFQVLGDEPAIGADEQDLGNTLDTEGRGDGIRQVSLVAEVALLPGQLAMGRVAAWGVGLDIHAQADHDEARITAEGVVRFLERGDIGN